MRTQIALTVLAVVLGAGCTTASEDATSEQAAEMPASPDDAGAELASDETTSPDESTDSATVNEPTDTEDPADDVADDDDEDAASDVTVSIGDYFFEPDGLTVESGDTVMWTHDGDITHNVTARDGSFASANLASGETFARTFTSTGSFEYRCTLHGQMIATIDVS